MEGVSRLRSFLRSKNLAHMIHEVANDFVEVALPDSPTGPTVREWLSFSGLIRGVAVHRAVGLRLIDQKSALTHSVSHFCQATWMNRRWRHLHSLSGSVIFPLDVSGGGEVLYWERCELEATVMSFKGVVVSLVFRVVL
jgi:hypothetical protein